MANYKVPQDVEADDKLIGPFSFRQFIYLIIVAMCGALAWGLWQLFPALAIIPLPVIVFFGALALPLRKDQPMEIYMAALVSFYLKPRQRQWDPEGIESLIEITAPKTVEVHRTKDLSQGEAEERLSYLANIIDTGGWAIRGVPTQPNPTMNNDIFLEAQGATDVLDTSTAVAHNFDEMMSKSTDRMHEEARARMMEATQPVTVPVPAPVAPQAATPTDEDQQLLQAMAQQVGQGSDDTNLGGVHFNPYPTFHQSVIQPLNDTSHQAESDIEAPKPKKHQEDKAVQTAAKTEKANETAKATSDTALTADIINLANNPDLSIETIAHEAQRIHKKAEMESEEVVISLR